MSIGEETLNKLLNFFVNVLHWYSACRTPQIHLSDKAFALPSKSDPFFSGA